MKIRTITYFCTPTQEGPHRLGAARRFIQQARQVFQEEGWEVQTLRLATPPFPGYAPFLNPPALTALAQALEQEAAEAGFQHLSLGPALPELPGSYLAIPEVLSATQMVSLSGQMTRHGGRVSLEAVKACARAILDVSQIGGDGFANFRFTAAANVPPGTPFFPAGYHHPGAGPAFALGTEAAGLAVQAFSEAEDLEDARRRLVLAVEEQGGRLTRTAQRLAGSSGAAFGGIDFSLAPFPSEPLSIGTALERLGLPAVGLHGSLAAAALLAESLDRASFPHTGFSGLMLPVLEDYTLAQRAAEGTLRVKDLLLYSAVCGTGLDTVPLPGDVSPDRLAALLLDLAALALRLDKPLTARLLPLPGKQAGDPLAFDFAFFANSRVMALEAEPLLGPLGGVGEFELKPRKQHQT